MASTLLAFCAKYVTFRLSETASVMGSPEPPTEEKGKKLPPYWDSNAIHPVPWSNALAACL